jgi:hypothetical protein
MNTDKTQPGPLFSIGVDVRLSAAGDISAFLRSLLVL